MKRLPIPRYKVAPFIHCIEPDPYNRQCKYFYEEPDMGGHIPTCMKFAKLGYCPCEDCKEANDG